MTSAINTSSINTNYPVAGVNNSSQGFRDNFNAIKQNLNAAGSEITDIQDKGIYKSALLGQTLNNDMAGGIISNVLTRGFRGAGVNLGTNVSGVITVDTNVADVYYGTITGNVSLEFTKWAPAGTIQSVRVILQASNTVNYEITLPPSISNSRLYIPGIDTIDSFVINTLSNYPTLDLLFTTVDCGTNIDVQVTNKTPRAIQIVNRTPEANLTTGNLVGAPGDVLGSMAVNTAGIWFANGTYDGTSNIWTPVFGAAAPSPTTIQNGTTSVSVPTANGNVLFRVNNTANILQVTPNGVSILGTIGASGNIGTTGNINATGSGLFTGNIQAGNGFLAGNLTVLGNLTYGGLSTAGNITAGNLLSTGNITGANLIANANATIGGSLSATGSVRGANLIINSLVTIRTIGSFSAYTLTLPTTPGTAGQVLSTDGSGGLSWITASGGGGGGGGNGTAIVNGNSNVVVSANSSITMGVSGNANVITISNTATSITGNVTIVGNLVANNITGTASGVPSIISTSDVTINAGSGSGQLNVTGNIRATTASSNGGFLIGKLIIQNQSIPSNSSSNGTAGQFAYDSTYLYICTGTNTWRRVNLGSAF